MIITQLKLGKLGNKRGLFAIDKIMLMLLCTEKDLSGFIQNRSWDLYSEPEGQGHW